MRMQVSTGKPFNLGVSFADFLADETRTELTLPPMSTEQRKEAKRLDKNGKGEGMKPSEGLFERQKPRKMKAHC